ncbi:MAG: hypothetical protein AAF333_08555 [Planctomycetota bacterium]
MKINPYNVTRFVSQQQRFNREVNSTIERLNAGVTVRPKDDPAAFAAYQQTRVYENRVKTASVNADRAQAFGNEALGQLDKATAIVDELRELYVADGNPAATQTRINELLAGLDQLNADSEFAGRPLFSGSTAAPGPTAAPTEQAPAPIPTLGGIQLGVADGDLGFRANIWKGQPNLGEFEVTGTQFTRSRDAGATPVALGGVKNGVAARDNATGTGYILHSEQPVHSRFSPPPHRDNSTNLVAVVYDQGQWYYDNNNVLTAFTPETTDTLIASVDFDNDTITALTLPEPQPAPVPAPSPTPGGTAEARPFEFTTTPELATNTSAFSLGSVAAADLGDQAHTLADLAAGGALAYATGDRAAAITALDVARGDLDAQRERVKTFVRHTVGSIQAVNEKAGLAAATRREQLETRAGARANADAARLMLLSAGQALAADAAETQADTLIALLEQSTGTRAPRAVRSASFFQAGLQEQQQRLADAMDSYRQAAATGAEPQDQPVLPDSVAGPTEAGGLDITG